MELFKLFEKPIRVALALGLGGIVLTGCGEEGPEFVRKQSATVLEHEYHEPYSSLMLVGKVLIPIYHDEEYHFEVRQCAAEATDLPNSDESCVTAHVEVDKDTYDKYPDGAQVTLET